MGQPPLLVATAPRASANRRELQTKGIWWAWRARAIEARLVPSHERSTRAVGCSAVAAKRE